MITSLPNDKMADQSNLKAFADNILNVVQMMICVTDWVAFSPGNQHFLLFPQCFQKAFSPGLLKVGIVW